MKRVVLLTIVLGSTMAACSEEPSAGADAAMDAATDAATHASCTTAAQCDDGVFCNGLELCVSSACAPGAAPCVATQTCDEAADRCVTSCTVDPDADDDGRRAVACGGDDCDDADSNRFPGNPEVCDSSMHDEDCDTTTFGVRDADSDGFADARCCNAGTPPTCGTDCNDTSASVHPSEAESCDGLDNDCDSAVDELVLRTFHRDADNDGFGTMMAAMSMQGCSPPAGYREDSTDCNDGDGTIHPGALEQCDPAMVDENCDGVMPVCACTGTMTRACPGASGACATGIESCGPDGTYGTCSIQPTGESCNNLDDDCDGTVDNGVRVTCYPDADGDGYAAASAVAAPACPVPSRPEVGGCPVNQTNLAPTTTADCDDTDSMRSPAFTEFCNMRDDDCSGVVDDGLTVPCYRDVDNDTYAAMGAALSDQCPDLSRPLIGNCPLNYTNRAPATTMAIDCDDASSAVNPGAPEQCNAIDDDCDGTPDDGARVACWADADDDGYAAASAISMMFCRDPARMARGYCPPNQSVIDPSMPGQADCDDRFPQGITINPGAPEQCDTMMIDHDCDGSYTDVTMVTCYTDTDTDNCALRGAAPQSMCPDANRPTFGNCPTGFTGTAPAACDDCVDTDMSIHQGVTETCTVPAVDQNCNGNADEGLVTCYPDGDNDTWPALAGSSQRCRDGSRSAFGYCPVGYTAAAGSWDCDDASASLHTTIVCYDTSGDADAYGAGAGSQVCALACPAGSSTVGGDCCPTDARAYPGEATYYGTPTACGGYDFNCDGSPSERIATGSEDCSLQSTIPECGSASGGSGFVGSTACGAYNLTYLAGCRWVSGDGCNPRVSTGNTQQTCR